MAYAMEDVIIYWPLISFMLYSVVLSIAVSVLLARTKGLAFEFLKKYFQTYWLVDGVKYALPNGPNCYPFIGSCYVLSAGISNAISKLAGKFGPIFTVYIFRIPCICINDFELIRQVHTGKNYQNRPKFEVMASLCGEASQQNNGLLFSYGDVWKTHRRLTLRYLHDQGMGKTKGDEIILAEAAVLCSKLRENAETRRGIDPKEFVTKATASLLTRILFGKPLCEGDNESMVKFFEFVRRMIHSNSSSITLPLLLESYPWMKYFPFPELKQFIENTRGITEQFAHIAKNRNSSSGKTFKDFIDIYHQMMEESQNSSNLSIKSLIWTLTDLYIAATDTTSVVLLQLIRFLTVYPQIQDRIYEEICDNIGSFEAISYRSVENMHFTNAFIHEVLRIEPPATIGIPRMAIEDAILGGYYIPKGAMVLCNIRGAHHDPKYWENPAKLDPLRFLDDKGCFRKCRHYVPFSYGKRKCAGETLAQAQVYIFLVALVREFKILPPKNFKLDMTTFYWPISTTAQFKIRLECRIR